MMYVCMYICIGFAVLQSMICTCQYEYIDILQSLNVILIVMNGKKSVTALVVIFTCFIKYFLKK